MTAYPLLALRDHLVFPEFETGIYIGRPQSLEAIRLTVEKEGLLLVCTQKEADQSEPKALDDFYTRGTLCRVVRQVSYPDGQSKIILRGERCIDVCSIACHNEALWGEGTGVNLDEQANLSPEEALASHTLLSEWTSVKDQEELTSQVNHLKTELNIERHANQLCSLLSRWRQCGPLPMREAAADESRSFTASVTKSRVNLLLENSPRERLTKAHSLMRFELAQTVEQ